MKYCGIILLCVGACLALPPQVIEASSNMTEGRQYASSNMTEGMQYASSNMTEGRQYAAGGIGSTLASIIRPILEGVATGLNNVLGPEGTSDDTGFEAYVMRIPGSDSPAVILTQEKNEESLMKTTGLPLEKIKVEKYEDIKEQLKEMTTEKA